MLQLTANTFDVATFEIWGALLRGGKLVLFPGRVASGEELQRLIRREGIETMWLTSAHYSGVAESGVEALAGVKQLVIGGEALPVKAVREGMTRLAETEFINGYGPTEVTVFGCSHRVQETVAEGWEHGVPIGKPLNNTESYVLDERGQLLPVGVVGELYLGGAGVARGYVGDPSQTAERFVPHAYARREGERLYRTGDLARWRADGALEFMGRVDEQVKLRGYRIEPGEIEQALREHEAVQDAVVIVRADGGEEKRLVAYVVAAAEAVSVSELWQHLRERLPEYMVPWSYEFLERLPLNTSGKVDRDALPAPSSSREGAGEYMPPRTATEEILTNIWSQVLSLQRVGINDNFFQLGGHSLTAMQIVSRVRKTFQVELPLRELFESPTIAELSDRLDQERRRTQEETPIPPLVPVERNQHLLPSFAQQRLWFLDQLESGLSFYNLSAAIRMRGALNVEVFEQTLTEISRRHESLRTSFQNIDGRPVQIIAEPQTIKLLINDLSDLSEEERGSVLERTLREESNRPFDLSRGPLFRTALLKLSEEDYVLLLTMHHIITDGWSMGVFVRELAIIYDAYLNQRPLELPELPIQYVDFAHWQRQWMQGEVLQEQLDYWRTRLSALPMLRLPSDRPRPATPTYRGAKERFFLPPEMVASLQAMSRSEGVTLFMVLLAAWQALLYRYTGQNDIATGSVIANRNRSEIEGLIGFFVNTLILRTDLSRNPSFRQLLVRVREVCLGAYAHQDVPFEQLVDALQPERAVGHMPFVRVMFSFQAASAEAVELPNLTLNMLDLDIDTSPFDLSLSLAAGPDGPLAGLVRYSTDIFDADTIKRTIKHYERLLGSIVNGLETRIDDLEFLTQAEKEQEALDKSGRKQLKLQKLRSSKPKALSLSQQNLIKTEYLPGGGELPLVVQPQVEGINLVTWAQSHKEFIDQELLKHGAILFRNFQLNSIARFEEFAQAICPDLMTYSERSSPRDKVGGHVYTSTTHPAEQSIHLHNEHSYTLRWPMKLWFFCVKPAEQGGRTPIADSRKILRRIDPKIVEKFIEKQIMYARNYGDGLGLPWQEVFQTTDRATVEEYCRQNDIEVQWKDDNRLRTRQVRPAVRRHPKSNVHTWFNHAAFFHISNLEEAERTAALSVLTEEELPFNTFYGDGSPIETSILEEIREAYLKEMVSFSWQQDDILMLDNMLVAHGRDPYAGSRKIVFVMADPIQNPHETSIVREPWVATVSTTLR
jgi:non-ribosomal peptide synthetase component F/alpha-ketoglutarate-dependent taurine dioxygenase/acyl carrier protein